DAGPADAAMAHLRRSWRWLLASAQTISTGAISSSAWPGPERSLGLGLEADQASLIPTGERSRAGGVGRTDLFFGFPVMEGGDLSCGRAEPSRGGSHADAVLGS